MYTLTLALTNSGICKLFPFSYQFSSFFYLKCLILYHTFVCIICFCNKRNSTPFGGTRPHPPYKSTELSCNRLKYFVKQTGGGTDGQTDRQQIISQKGNYFTNKQKIQKEFSLMRVCMCVCVRESITSSIPHLDRHVEAGIVPKIFESYASFSFNIFFFLILLCFVLICTPFLTLISLITFTMLTCPSGSS